MHEPARHEVYISFLSIPGSGGAGEKVVANLLVHVCRGCH